MKLVNY